MDRCVNCGIATNRCNTLGRRVLDDEMILSVIQQWRAPQPVSSSDYVCQLCWDNAQRPNSEGTRQPGHRNVCLRCGRSLASQVSHLLHTGSTRELRIYNVIQEWIMPQTIGESNHICHRCWVAADRAATRMMSGPSTSSQGSHLDEVKVLPAEPPLIQDLPAEPPLGGISSNQSEPDIVLPNYMRAIETERRCFIEGCQRTERATLPDQLETFYNVAEHEEICVKEEYEELLDNQVLITTEADYETETAENTEDIVHNPSNQDAREIGEEQNILEDAKGRADKPNKITPKKKKEAKGKRKSTCSAKVYENALALPLDTSICKPCLLLLNTEAGENERLLGHNMVCLGCGKSVRKIRHHNISMDCPLLAPLLSQNTNYVIGVNTIITRVYNFFKKEFDYLTKTYGEALDLTPFCKYKERTAEATGFHVNVIERALREEQVAEKNTRPQKRQKKKNPKDGSETETCDETVDSEDSGTKICEPADLGDHCYAVSSIIEVPTAVVKEEPLEELYEPEVYAPSAEASVVYEAPTVSDQRTVTVDSESLLNTLQLMTATNDPLKMETDSPECDDTLQLMTATNDPLKMETASPECDENSYDGSHRVKEETEICE